MQRLARWVASGLSPSPLPQPSEGIEGERSVDVSTRVEEAGTSNSTSAAERPHSPPAEKKDKSAANDEQVQRNAALLAELGIKTRDFAYESKLPPIRSVPYVPVQTCRPRVQLDTPSRLPPPEDVTYSQLGFTPDRSPSSEPAHREASPPPIRPLTFTPTSGTPSGSSQPPPSLPATRRRRGTAAATARGSTRRTRQHDVVEPPAPARSSRYNLRERTAPVRGVPAVKSRAVRANASRQEGTGKGAASPPKKGKGKTAQASAPKRGPKSSPPKRTTRKTAKQALLT
ncbi:uncharacterized protein B0H18DRAFT_1118510 [Fomitopsis serialis]|uniref:uncharacterized protein n=1 Tax=Fomitopsis serialis TaxID=139415 RepID=UPI002007F703|nr:uncharacterized protein B0H18DRAFT_1118510 [Neoantrodia serialis]KAH9927236.1 hypothetical protein B0H18DRAFT_1118510 [Neoantrodia serialis]